MILLCTAGALPHVTGDLQQLPQKLQAAWQRALKAVAGLAPETAMQIVS